MISPEDSKNLQSLESFFRTVRPYLLYRSEDDVLIVPPNRVFKLNDTAAGLFRWLDAGGNLESISGLDRRKVIDIDVFMRSIQDALDGKEQGTERMAFTFDFTRLPVLGEIAVTKKCNNACRFCYAGCGEDLNSKLKRNPSRQMSTAQLKKIIRIFKNKAKIPFFSFTGGEPLLRDDLEKCIRYAEKQGLRTNLISNGSLVSAKRAAALYRAGLRTAQISLEASEAELHDMLVGRRGAFERTLAGIRFLQDAGISVQTNTTICAPNLENVQHMPAFISELGIKRFSMNMFIPFRENPGSEELYIPYSDIGDVVDTVRKAAARAGLTFYWYSPTPFCHYNPIARGLGNKSCAAMDGLISVDFDGSVLPCSSYNMNMGNLLDKAFADVWFSERAAFFKQKKYAPAECEECPSFTACQAACPLYWEYAGCAEIKNPAGYREKRKVL